MKIHTGPLNLSTVSMKRPSKLIQEFKIALHKFRVDFSQPNPYRLLCISSLIKFSIELNQIGLSNSLFTVKINPEKETKEYYKIID